MKKMIMTRETPHTMVAITGARKPNVPNAFTVLLYVVSTIPNRPENSPWRPDPNPLPMPYTTYSNGYSITSIMYMNKALIYDDTLPVNGGSVGNVMYAVLSHLVFSPVLY